MGIKNRLKCASFFLFFGIPINLFFYLFVYGLNPLWFIIIFCIMTLIGFLVGNDFGEYR